MMKTIIVTLLVLSTCLLAGDIKGSFFTGAIMGTGLFTGEEFTDRENINYDYPNLQWVNQLRLNGKVGSAFSYRLNGLHTTGFATDSTTSDARIYEVMGKYNFSRGHIKLGRITNFNRWIWGSIDGLAISYDINNQLSVSARGGMSVRYGDFYDSDNAKGLGYFDLAYHKKNYGVKAKGLYTEDATRAGVDFYARMNWLRISGDYGYDITNERLSDGGLNLLVPVSAFTFTGNYRLMRSVYWPFSSLNYSYFKKDYAYLIERFMLGIRYQLDNNYHLNFKQMVSMTSNRTDYVSYLTLNHKIFFIGVNYFSGDSKYERLTLTAGANYEVMNNLWLSAGIAPVDYKYHGYDENIQTLISYLKVRYRFLGSFTTGAYFNMYNYLKTPEGVDNDSKMRAQVFLQYNLGS